MLQRLYVGTGAWEGEEPGIISTWAFRPESGLLELRAELEVGGLPSFLCHEPALDRLYAADERRGGVASFSLDARGRPSRAVRCADDLHPVYVAVHAARGQLLTANYSEGVMAAYEINSVGDVAGRVYRVVTGAKTHCVVPLSDGVHSYVANTGADTITHLAHDADAAHEASVVDEALPARVAGGPRHLVFDHAERFAYVTCEYDDKVAVFERVASGQLRHLQSVQRLPPGESADPSRDAGADAVLSPDGTTLYVSNRGRSNTVAAFPVNPNTGLLGSPHHAHTGGEIPRKLAVHPSGHWLLAANRVSRTLAVFALDQAGMPTLQDVVEVSGSPFFVGFSSAG